MPRGRPPKIKNDYELPIVFDEITYDKKLSTILNDIRTLIKQHQSEITTTVQESSGGIEWALITIKLKTRR